MNKHERDELIMKSVNALEKIKNRKIKEEELKLYSKPKVNFIKLTEEYNEEDLKNKFELDRNVYGVFFRNLEEPKRILAEEVLDKLETQLTELYEVGNLKPKMHGFSKLSIDSAKKDLIEESTRLINKYLNLNYYNLSTIDRERKYKENVLTETKEILNENSDLNVNDALEFSYKYILIKNFLKKTSIPYFVNEKINELIESDVYDEFFDSNRLSIILSECDEHLNDLSKIISISL